MLLLGDKFLPEMRLMQPKFNYSACIIFAKNKTRLCVINIFSKYGWVVPLKVEKGIGITNPLLKVLHKSKSEGCKSNKIWTEEDSKF